MKKKFNCLLFMMLMLLMGSTVSAQQANIWYFGQNAGLDFNSTVTPITGGALATNEGCASICDNTGALLFYTDGIWIWDNTHTIINGGTPLKGHPSSTQSAIIIPRPGTSNYYIFTQDAQGLGACTVGMHYSEVNVSGTTVTVVTANTFLYGCSSTTEKVTAACHANGTDYWAITVLQNGDFVAWPISNTGVGTAVISSGMASADIGTDDRVGYMKVSPLGTHIVLGRRQWNSVNEAFTFDNSTGVVTSNMGTYHTGTVYGVEFSSDGNYFYTTENFHYAVQYQLTSGFPNTTIFTSPAGTPNDLGALQMGPDGNIYVANGYEGTNGFYLDMISNVNTYPATYNDNFITLPPGTYSRLGLPDYVPCFVPNVECNLESSPSFAYNPQTCSYQFTDMSTHGVGTDIVAWEWTFGDGTSSNLQNPEHYYTTPGSYLVCLTVTGYDGKKCCVSTKCIQIEVREVCNMPCIVQHQIVTEIDDCDPCTVHFSGVILYANRQVVAWIWDFGDGTTGVGENVSHTYSSPGPHTVCLKVIARGFGDECCVFETCIPVQTNCPKPRTAPPANQNQPQPQGSFPKINDIGLKAYPNPASTNLHVEFEAPANQNLKLQLVDYTGKVVLENNVKNSEKGTIVKNINISNLSTGIYLLVIEGENLKLTEKIQVVKN